MVKILEHEIAVLELDLAEELTPDDGHDILYQVIKTDSMYEEGLLNSSLGKEYLRKLLKLAPKYAANSSVVNADQPRERWWWHLEKVASGELKPDLN